MALLLLNQIVARCVILLLLSTTTTYAWNANYEPNHEAIYMGNNENKKLVFLVGPHNSAYTSVEQFIQSYHGPFRKGHPNLRSLTYWRWGGNNPNIVIDPTNPNVDEYLKSIKETFEKDDGDMNGIVVSSQWFDQVGSDATYDAISAMDRVVTYLNVHPKDVMVIVNYRTPRVEQWISMWKHVTEGYYAESTYEEWMCDTHDVYSWDDNEEERNLRRDMLGARMNPLNAVSVYLQQGYNVKLIDLGGVDKSGQSLVHVVAAQILLGETSDGLVTHHKSKDWHFNSGEKEFTELNDKEYGKIERLFRFRDCSYQRTLKEYTLTGQLEIMYKDSMWNWTIPENDNPLDAFHKLPHDYYSRQGGGKNGVYEVCDSRQTPYYTKLANDTDALYSALLSQLECKYHEIKTPETSMNAALGMSENEIEIIDIITLVLVIIAAIVLYKRLKNRYDDYCNNGDGDETELKGFLEEEESESNNNAAAVGEKKQQQHHHFHRKTSSPPAAAVVKNKVTSARPKFRDVPVVQSTFGSSNDDIDGDII